MTVVVPLVDVTLRAMLGRRRTVLLVLLAGLPVLVALLIRVSGGRPDADRVLDTLVVRFVMALVALIVGTAVLGSEIEDGTAVYLMVKPIARWRIVLAKAIVAIGLTAALVVPAVLLTGLILGGQSDSMTITLAFAVACLVGGSAYAVAFMALSVFTSRAFLRRARLRPDLGRRPVRAPGRDEVPVDPAGDAGPRVGPGRRDPGRSAGLERQPGRAGRRDRRRVPDRELAARRVRDPRRRLTDPRALDRFCGTG